MPLFGPFQKWRAKILKVRTLRCYCSPHLNTSLLSSTLSVPDRWKLISQAVGRSARECADRYKALRAHLSEAKAKGEAEKKARDEAAAEKATAAKAATEKAAAEKATAAKAADEIAAAAKAAAAKAAAAKAAEQAAEQASAEAKAARDARVGSVTCISATTTFKIAAEKVPAAPAPIVTAALPVKVQKKKPPAPPSFVETEDERHER
jgi:septal ring factor EnvC (AmiA/AmiB activator)